MACSALNHLPRSTVCSVPNKTARIFRQPVAGFLHVGHLMGRPILFGRRGNGLEVGDHRGHVVGRNAAGRTNLLHGVQNRLLLRRRQVGTVENRVAILRSFCCCAWSFLFPETAAARSSASFVTTAGDGFAPWAAVVKSFWSATVFVRPEPRSSKSARRLLMFWSVAWSAGSGC